MDNNMALDALGWILNDVRDNAESARKEYAQDDSEYNSGYDQAYSEVMAMIRTRLEILGIEVSEGK